MELKRILARDSRTATAKAIELYGRDALIVSNERVNGQAEVIVDVNGWFSSGAGFRGMTPVRVSDTRSGIGNVPGR